MAWMVPWVDNPVAPTQVGWTDISQLASPPLVSGTNIKTINGSAVLGSGDLIVAGSPGPEGPEGPQGIQGPAGNDGAQGIQGIQGIQGPAGADGAAGAQGPAGVGGACLPLVADGAGLTLTNMALALAFLAGSHRYAGKIDLTSCTQCRLIVNKQGTAGAASAKIILRYISAFSTTAANWLDIGASEVSVAINVQNTVLASAWIDLAALAKADVFIAPLCSGGDGALDPVVGNIVAQFK